VEFYLHSPICLEGVERDKLPFFRYNLISVIMRRIFEPKRNEVTGEWRIIHNEELHDQYS
jgi:hypothetical protein